MKSIKNRRDSQIFVLEKEGETHILEDIWLSELGLIMVSIREPKNKCIVNYPIEKIENLKPVKFTVKGVDSGFRQS
jgi:hypothetical protein